MAAPLPASFTAPAPPAEPAKEPVRAPLSVSSAKMTPAPRPAQPAVPARNLFDDVEDQTPAAFDDDPEDILDASDDLPAPVYRPAAAPARDVAAALEADAAGFVAPRPRPTGTPSPEALARLQAAVSKAPAGKPAVARPAAAAPVGARTAPAAAAPEAGRPRFGIGSLINRMAGHSEAPAERSAQTARQQPRVSSYEDEAELNADQERIEIPAFLRRQAN
jgi:cell division protein FtsZ